MNKQPFWQFGIPDENELETLDVLSIECVEKELDVKLPISYLNLLKEKNGGMLYIPQEIPNVYPDDNILQIDYLFGVSHRKYEGILKTLFYSKEWNLPKNVVILAGDGHWWLVLDYRNYTGDNPPLSLLDSNYDLDVFVSEDFSVFLNKLKPLYPGNLFELYPIPKTHYEKEKVEEAIKLKKDALAITEGFDYILNNEGDLHWALKQLRELVNISNYQVVLECLYYFYEYLKTSNVKLDVNDFQDIYMNLLKYPRVYLDSEEVIPRMGRRIYKFLGFDLKQ